MSSACFYTRTGTPPSSGKTYGIINAKANFKPTARYALKTYILATLSDRVYVVNPPELVLSCQRFPKIISFWFIDGAFTAKLRGMSKEASERTVNSLRGEQLDYSIIMKGIKATHQTMAPGQELDAIFQTSCEIMATALEQFKMKPEARRVDLWE